MRVAYDYLFVIRIFRALTGAILMGTYTINKGNIRYVAWPGSYSLVA